MEGFEVLEWFIIDITSFDTISFGWSNMSGMFSSSDSNITNQELRRKEVLEVVEKVEEVELSSFDHIWFDWRLVWPDALSGDDDVVNWQYSPVSRQVQDLEHTVLWVFTSWAPSPIRWERRRWRRWRRGWSLPLVYESPDKEIEGLRDLVVM